jgi:hypothetical protein
MIDDDGRSPLNRASAAVSDSYRSAQELLAQARQLEHEADRLQTLQATSWERMSAIRGLHKQYLQAARDARVAVADILPEEWDR